MPRKDLKLLRPKKLTMGPFIQKVIPHCNYMDPATVEMIYRAIIRAIVVELRNQGAINLPDFGVFEVSDILAHKIKIVQTGEWQDVPTTRTVKFRPGDALKKYFYKVTAPMVE